MNITAVDTSLLSALDIIREIHSQPHKDVAIEGYISESAGSVADLVMTWNRRTQTEIYHEYLVNATASLELRKTAPHTLATEHNVTPEEWAQARFEQLTAWRASLEALKSPDFMKEPESKLTQLFFGVGVDDPNNPTKIELNRWVIRQRTFTTKPVKAKSNYKNNVTRAKAWIREMLTEDKIDTKVVLKPGKFTNIYAVCPKV